MDSTGALLMSGMRGRSAPAAASAAVGALLAPLRGSARPRSSARAPPAGRLDATIAGAGARIAGAAPAGSSGNSGTSGLAAAGRYPGAG